MSKSSISQTIIERFNAKVEIREGSDCHWWTGSSWIGYGQISVNNKLVKAHRLSYEIRFGKIPDGMNACHKCDNPACVNPDHIFLGTQLDNVRDMMEKGRHVSKKGEEQGLSKLKNSDVIEIRALEGKMTQTEIGRIYGVHQKSIWQILKRRTWKHLL